MVCTVCGAAVCFVSYPQKKEGKNSWYCYKLFTTWFLLWAASNPKLAIDFIKKNF